MSVDPVVVVGAGPGGLSVARRLAGSHGVPVVVLEAGSSRASLALDGAARTTLAGPLGRYPRGVGVGGGAAVNGGVLSWGHPGDHDSWAATVGDDRWSWSSVRRRYAAIAAGVRPVAETAWGPAGRLLGAIAEAHGARRVDDLSRCEPGGDQFGPFAVDGGARPATCATDRLEVEVGAEVARLVAVDGRIVGVALADGDERRAAHVVLAAGVLGTTRLLRGAGIETCDVTDHPGIVVTVPIVEHDDDAPVAVGARFSSPKGVDDVQFVALNRTATPGVGAIVVSLIAPNSRGSVDAASGMVEAGALEDPRDLAAMRWALRMLRERLLGTVAAGEARAGRDGSPLETLDPTPEWLRANVDGVWHLCGGARIGRVADARGAVAGWQGLWVADASALPGTPRANPQLATMVLAEIVADAISVA